MRIRDISEIELIKRLSKAFRVDSSVVMASGDDTAVLKWTKDEYLLFTCDMVVEDVHFRFANGGRNGHATPFQIGWKALGRNISDIAAMGGVPRYAVVSLGIDSMFNVAIAEGICKGIKNIADRFRVSVVGGDMSESHKMVIDVSMIGHVKKKALALRSGAKKGDLVLVTGSLGGSLKRKHLNFVPRVRESQNITGNFKVNSMIDISDGLALDLHRIAEASDVGACLYEESIPMSRDAARLSDALYDGEDYELLFTMKPEEAERLLRSNFSRVMTRVSLIGEITDKKYGYKIIREDGSEENLKIKGYLHFGAYF